MEEKEYIGISIVWCDRNLSGKENIFYQNVLNTKFPISCYVNSEDAISKVKSQTNCYFLIVTSGRLSKKIITEVHNEDNVLKILIFCAKPEKYISLCEEWKKVLEPTTSLFGVLDFLTKTTQSCIICFSPIEDEQKENLTDVQICETKIHYYHKACKKKWRILARGDMCPLCSKNDAIYEKID